jgi:hypothetical protein
LFKSWERIAIILSSKRDLIVGQFNCEKPIGNLELCSKLGIDRFPAVFFLGNYTYIYNRILYTDIWWIFQYICMNIHRYKYIYINIWKVEYIWRIRNFHIFFDFSVIRIWRFSDIARGISEPVSEIHPICEYVISECYPWLGTYVKLGE